MAAPLSRVVPHFLATAIDFASIPMVSTGIEPLLATRTDLWRGRGPARAAVAGLGTGFAALDQALPWGGWPADGLTEIMTEQPGSGLGLLLPLLVAASRRAGWVLLIDPPWLPYAPALAAHGLDLNRLVLVQAGVDAAWAMEQALRCGCCAAVLAWPDRLCGGAAAAAWSSPPATGAKTTGPAAWSATRLRRLQLAAADGVTPGLLLRTPAAVAQSSPAVLRLLVRPCADGLELTLLKLRGGRPGTRVRLGATAASSAQQDPQHGIPGGPAGDSRLPGAGSGAPPG